MVTYVESHQPAGGATLRFRLDNPVGRQAYNQTPEEYVNELPQEVGPINSNGQVNVILHPVVLACGGGIIICTSNADGFLGDVFLFRIQTEVGVETLMLELTPAAESVGETVMVTVLGIGEPYVEQP